MKVKFAMMDNFYPFIMKLKKYVENAELKNVNNVLAL